MALYTVLSPDDLSAVLAAYGLALKDAMGIAKGTINTNYRVDTDRGRFFLRVNEGKTWDEVEEEATLVAVLAGRGVTTPAVIRAVSGAVAVSWKDRYVTLFAWQDGRDLGRDEVTAAHTRAVGGALAALHAAGKDFPARAGRYTFELIHERFRSFESSRDPALARAIPILAAELSWLRAQDRSGLPAGVIHQDLFRDNVLWREPVADARLAALIDFEQACAGAFAYDLAVCLNDWCFDDAFVPARAQALVAGYQAVRPLTPRERDALWTCARAAAMRFTITRITDVHLRAAASGERVVKEFGRYLARLEALTALGADGFREFVGW